MHRKLVILVVALVLLVAAVPAGAVLDEGGGAAPAPVVSADGGFDWGDAGIGAGMGVALAAVFALGVVATRYGRSRRVGTPATR